MFCLCAIAGRLLLLLLLYSLFLMVVQCTDENVQCTDGIVLYNMYYCYVLIRYNTDTAYT